MDSDWANLLWYAAGFEIESGSLVHVFDRARKNHVSADVVLEAYRRTGSFWAHYDQAADPAFIEFEALPPGLLDLRVLDQSVLWVDVLRTPHHIADPHDITDGYLANIIGWLHRFADTLAAGWARMHNLPPPPDHGTWLEQTILMQALRAEAHSRGTSGQMPPPAKGDR